MWQMFSLSQQMDVLVFSLLKGNKTGEFIPCKTTTYSLAHEVSWPTEQQLSKSTPEGILENGVIFIKIVAKMIQSTKCSDKQEVQESSW